MKTPENKFKSALKSGKKQYGFWLGLCNPLSAELCAYAGYDWLLIDAEHAPNDLQSIMAQLQAIQGTPSQPVVRLAEDHSTRIKQALDVGAQSLLIPMVETATQAREIVQSMQYPPRGIRGVGTALARAALWNRIEHYFDDVEDQLCLIIQIESTKGLDNLDEILAVDGVDAIFIGPADLAASMGHLGNALHDQVQTAIDSAIHKINAAGKAVGTLAVDKSTAQRYESMGVQFLALGVDTLALAGSARSTLADYLADSGR